MKRKPEMFLNLSHLRVLVAVATHHSFSEAALQLEMSQSAVSNAIATLEDHLGVVLFFRGRHGARLTPVGDRIFNHAQHMLAVQEAIVKDANLARSLEGGEIRISAFRSVSTQILPEIMAQFQQRFPEIVVKLVEHLDNPHIVDDLQNGRADVGFTDEVPNTQDFDAWELIQDEYVVLLPPNYPVTGATLDWEQLKHPPFIMASEGDGCDAQVYQHCEAFGVSLHVAYHVRADSTIVSMVERGLGATIIPRLAAEPIPSGVQVFSLPVPLFRSIWVVTLATVLQPPPVFALLDLLKTHSRT